MSSESSVKMRPASLRRLGRVLGPGIGEMAWYLLLIVLIAIGAWTGSWALVRLETRQVLQPHDAPLLVTCIVSLTTAGGVLVGGVLTGMAKIIKARGGALADEARARTEEAKARTEEVKAHVALLEAQTRAIIDLKKHEIGPDDMPKALKP